MKQIIIKEIRFLNFKGFRERTIEFNAELTSICGRNGLGKTSIFDGFTWLLFGKDSQDRKTFDLKTLGADGNAIPRLPHEVSALLTIDGEEIELCRRFTEKWVKPKGSAEEEFRGHEEERLYNNVPLSLKEWNEKISAICSEQVFKFITNPSYFVSQKPDVQRQMLFRMAGEVSDTEIAAGNADFTALLASITGKSMEEYKKEIQAKKRRIKAEIEAIPDRIDERKRDIAMLAGYDFADLEESLTKKQKELEDIEAEILDRSKKKEAQIKAHEELIIKLGQAKERKLNLEFEIKEEAMKDYRTTSSKQNEIKQKIAKLQHDIILAEERIGQYNRSIEECNAIREKLIAEWKTIKAETISFNEKDFICPTCNRRFDIDEIESKQQEMTENFNAHKAARIKENESKGKANKQKIDDCNLAIRSAEKDIEGYRAEIESLTSSEWLKKELSAPEIIYNKDARWCEADETITALNQQIANEGKQTEESGDRSSERKALITDIDQIKQTLGNRDVIKRNKERISELEKQLKSGAQEVAELERIEFTITAFNKARIEAIDSRINGMFSLVKFRMFEQQINGGEVETCEATANGVPYSGQNNAMQVNMGLDIINAICAFEGITAPIFFDNAESVNELIPTKSQMIRLVVTEDSDLIIK